MAASRKPETGESLYKAALAQMTPEMREAFIDACVASGIREEDVIHALILCQAKVLDALKSTHAREVASSVQAVINGVAQRVETIQKERVAAELKQQQL